MSTLLRTNSSVLTTLIINFATKAVTNSYRRGVHRRAGHSGYRELRRGERAACGRKVRLTLVVVGGIDPPQTEVVFTLIGKRHARFLLDITLKERVGRIIVIPR